METGCLDVLNVGSGHLKFAFDKSKPEEVEKARKVVTDMLKRGYMIFVLRDGDQVRVRKFDADTDEYILEEPDVAPTADKVYPKGKRGTGKRAGRRSSMTSSRATAIGPTAGG